MFVYIAYNLVMLFSFSLFRYHSRLIKDFQSPKAVEAMQWGPTVYGTKDLWERLVFRVRFHTAGGHTNKTEKAP